MTTEDADRLYAQVQQMDFEQLRLLMRWIYLEFARRCQTWPALSAPQPAEKEDGKDGK